MPESKKGIVILVFLIILVSLYLGFQIGEMQRLCKVCPPSEIDFSLFWEAYYKLQEKFTDKTKIKKTKFIKIRVRVALKTSLCLLGFLFIYL